MDSFSSSLFSTTPRPTPIVPSPLTKWSSSNHRSLNVFSVRIEDKPLTLSSSGRSHPPTTTKTTTFPRPQPPPPPHKSPPQPREPSFSATILMAFEDIINKCIDPPLKPSVDPRFVLSTNFAPVTELPSTRCDVVYGTLPACLDGAYIRNGPNPQFLPRGPYHLFDGDGMVHCLRISAGTATLSSRYIQTYKYKLERQANGNILPNVFSGFNGLVGSAARGALTAARVITGQFDLTSGIGLANTSLALIGGRLFALGESDLPYEIKVAGNGDVFTVGRHDFDGKLFMSMTAHPKLDPDTGETFAFRYGPVPPFLTYFWFDRYGNKHPDVPVFSLIRPSFLHDFAITKRYAIFPDIQIGMNPIEMVFGSGSPIGSDQGKVPRIGVIPRYAKDEREMRWFDVAGFNAVHVINAWDEVDEEGSEEIVVVAPNVLSVEHALERMELVHGLVEQVRIKLATGVVTRVPLSAHNLDFAVINPAYTGKKSRYIYAAVGDPMPRISGVVKLDVESAGRAEGVVARRMYAPECYGGEPFFVARDPANPDAEEDDGYVVTYVHDEKKGESTFLVMDAKSPSLEVFAAVRLPQRVPYGFHGLFVRDEGLQGLYA